MAGELGGLDHVRVLPQDELVVREAVRRDDLLVVHRPLQRAHLRVRVDGVDEGAWLGLGLGFGLRVRVRVRLGLGLGLGLRVKG